MENVNAFPFQPFLPPQELLENCFSKELYSKVSKKDPLVDASDKSKVSNHSLKYLIALNSRDDGIQNFIDKCVEQKNKQLNSSFPQFGVTALHVATLKGKKNIVEMLIRAGADLNTKDEFGWTPLHHSALISDEIFQLLIKNGANQDYATSCQAKFDDLQRLAGIERTIDKRTIFYKSYLITNSQEIEIQQIENLTGLKKYMDEILYTSYQLLWLSTPADELSIESGKKKMNQLKEIYRLMRNEPPALTLNEILFPQNNGSSQKAWGVSAKVPLKLGQGVIEYTGEYIQEEIEQPFISDLKNPYKYLYGQINAESCGNMSRFINDGWPNLCPIAVINEKGNGFRKLFLVIEENGIEEDRQLFWDYGCTCPDVKWGNYVVFEREKIRAFFKSKSIKDCESELLSIKKQEFENHKKEEFDWDLFLKGGLLEQHLVYPLHTPAVLIDLACSKTVEPKLWKSILNFSDIPRIKLIHYKNPEHENWTHQLLNILIEFDGHLKKIEEKNNSKNIELICEEIRYFFIDLQDKLSVLQIVNGFLMTNLVLKKIEQHTDLLENEWKNLKQNLLSLNAYEWEKDPKFPFPKQCGLPNLAVRESELQTNHLLMELVTLMNAQEIEERPV